jgi:hypothetical protein
VDIIEASLKFERWMAGHTKVVKPDLAKKHVAMAESPFIFLRGTFYRWCQVWPVTCNAVVDAPIVPSVGDLHVENFGTWRDIEGRLVWGVNDVDEACRMPYTNDLVRLATSATLAARHGRLDREARGLCEAILDGYADAIDQGGRAFVLAERRQWLRRLALNKLRDPVIYWPKFEALPLAKGDVPHAIFRRALPSAKLSYRVVARVAGVGSLGRRRIVALAMCEGARVAREAKAWLPSALVWATGRPSLGESSQKLLARAVRSPDPFLQFHTHWIVRRLAPDCSRIELADLPRVRDEERLLRAMGAETANFHVRHARTAIRADLRTRRRRWLEDAAGAMADAMEQDWRRWVKHAG